MTPGRILGEAAIPWRRVGRMLQSAVSRVELPKDYPDRAIEVLWQRLPRPAQSWKVTRTIGHLIHRRVCRVRERGGGSYTRFFRNLPQLEVLRDLALEMPRRDRLKILVLGCSTGAELYSLLWMVRMARPEQSVQALGIDLSTSCVRAAAGGAYPIDATEVAGISETAYHRLFTRHADMLSVQRWMQDHVTWSVGDACSPDLPTQLGLQDLVLANNFLFHMSAARAEACLRNIVRLVAPNGYLSVAGVDLDVRSRVVHDMGLRPIPAKLEDIYAADGLLEAWPLHFWGLEPLDRRHRDWPLRYTTVFGVPPTE
jgi:SAM-dependent methyltransferase